MKNYQNKVCIFALLLICGIATAQVSRTQSGQALDSNYRVGSGGYNSATQSRQINSQLYVTGQVSGLRGFRGRVGYRGADEFRVELPSQTVERFDRQSIGLGQVLEGGTYLPSPYYRRDVTVFGAGEIIRGRTIPGTNIPRNPQAMAPKDRELYIEATKPYSKIMAFEMPDPLRSDPNRLIEYGDRAFGDPQINQQIKLPWMIDDSTETGVLGEEQREKLAEEISELSKINAQAEREVEAKVDAAVRGPAEDLDDESLPPLPKQTLEQQKRRQERQGPEGEDSPEDVFTDLLVRMRNRRMQQRTRGDQQQTERQREGERLPMEMERPGQDAARRPGVELSINRLAGSAENAFNRYMTQARSLLQQGRYYDAASQYELATTANPSNPLARLGRSIAFFAAGEPLTASLNLTRAMRMFPPLMKTRVEVGSLIGEKVFSSRLAMTDQRVSGGTEAIRDERSLMFLLAFMHHNADNTSEAKRYARKLKQVSGKDRLYSAYAEYLLTGDLPDNAKESAPEK